MIEKLLVKNYKILKDVKIIFNSDFNVFVGQNESGKSTILEAIGIATTGRLHFYSFERQLKSNLFNNEVRKEYIKQIVNNRSQRLLAPELPKIIIEIYLVNDDRYAQYRGTNNELKEDAPGIRVEVCFNNQYADLYNELLLAGSVDDIPVEFYKVSFKYFNGQEVFYRMSPVKSVLIDAAHKNYTHVVSQFINSNIDGVLSEQERIDISREYRSNRNAFKNSDNIKKLNKEVSERNQFDSRPISIDFQEETIDAWKEQMTITLDNVPFDNIGFGTQNVIKTELAIQNSPDKVNILLMEEPENNLSYTNMTRLLEQIRKTTEKQIFVATHSSYVANKLSLNKLLLVNKGTVVSFSTLSADTFKFFRNLPGYDTLRAVLAEKIIFVEGPTDQLIVERCYRDRYNCLPIDDGIDIIVAAGLTFKRFCDITILLQKKVVVITDNDGQPEKIPNRYKGYFDNSFVKFFIEPDPKLHTIEPSVLAVNCEKENDGGLKPKLSFQKIVNHNNTKQMTFDELDSFMENNKVEWAFRVFDAQDQIKYPKNIMDAIDEVKQYS